MKAVHTSVLGLAVGALCVWQVPSDGFARDLVIVTYGGATAKAMEREFNEPFAKAHGVKIRMENYSGGLAQVRAQVEAGNVTWDILDSDIPEARNGCAEDILEPIDVAALDPAPDGTPATDDFLSDTVAECGVGNYVYSLVLAYNTKYFPEGGPDHVSGVYDVEKYPGKRGLRKRPRGNLEWALMADGVAIEDVYDVLSTEAGVDRAFKKLDSIKDHVIWYESSAQAPQLLADGEVVMTSAFNARLHSAIVNEGQPFKLVWGGQVWATGAWVIPKGSPNKDLAMAYVKHATAPKAMAAFTSAYPYGPTRVSANQFVSAEAAELMPTADAHFKQALKRNDEFWAEYRDELNERFSAWLVK